MKKILLSLGAFVFLFSTAWSQDPMFEKEDKVLNLGIGLGSTLYSGSFYSSQIPPISASFEVGVVDEILEEGVIGVGGYIAYASYKWEYTDWGYKYTDFILGARGTFHYPFIDNLDTYTGLVLGYEIVSSKEIGNINPFYDYNTSSGGLVTSWFIGGRYYFSDNFAVLAELGYGITYLNLGVALKL